MNWEEPLFFVIFSIFKTWWWFLIPFPLYFICRDLYFHWLRWEVWYKNNKWVILEIIPPAIIDKPYRAMECLYASLWSFYNRFDWKGKWCEGLLPYGPYWFSFEIVSKEGEVHFYLRVLQDHRLHAETLIHTHYPEAEIFEVEDYTLELPQNIPNDEYDCKGEDYVFLKNNCYPIKTYKFFELGGYEFFKTTRHEQDLPEKKIDPLNFLLENLTQLKQGEYFWFQIVAAPILNSDISWQDEAKKIINIMSKRVEPPPKIGPIWTLPFDVIREFIAFTKYAIKFSIYTILSPLISEENVSEGKKPSSSLLITPGEDLVIKALEEKLVKPNFRTHLRALYVFKKNSCNDSHNALARQYLSNFTAENLNGLVLWSKTRTRIRYFSTKSRLYTRKKLLFEKYIKRLPPLYPSLIGKGTPVLSSEELTTIFHLPTTAGFLPAGVPRIMAKKGTPPPGLIFE